MGTPSRQTEKYRTSLAFGLAHFLPLFLDCESELLIELAEESSPPFRSLPGCPGGGRPSDRPCPPCLFHSQAEDSQAVPRSRAHHPLSPEEQLGPQANPPVVSRDKSSQIGYGRHQGKICSHPCYLLFCPLLGILPSLCLAQILHCLALSSATPGKATDEEERE